jgi:hypothetical protein
MKLLKKQKKYAKRCGSKYGGKAIRLVVNILKKLQENYKNW